MLKPNYPFIVESQFVVARRLVSSLGNRAAESIRPMMKYLYCAAGECPPMIKKQGGRLRNNLRCYIRNILVFIIWWSVTDASVAGSPNVVLILLDNVGQEWFGCYGSEERCTPNIDQLAATGIRVQHCYTAPVCGPSRVMLLTGRYPHSTGFRLHHDAALYSGGGLDPQRELLFPRLFREAGYVTGICGKWQVNNLYDEPNVITEHGFDQQLVWPGSLDSTKVQGTQLAKFWDAVKREDADETTDFIQSIESRYWDPVFLRNGQREELVGRFGPDVAQEFALQFVREHSKQPFLLYYPMLLTHGHTFTVPVVPTPDNRNPDRPHKEMFADMLRYADKLIGQFVVELDRLHLRDNTLLFIASDNGTEKSFHARRNGRVVNGGLYSLTESGGSVAFVANSPKLIPPGRTLTLADFTDIYPTLCELAGIAISPDHLPDGTSFAKYLLGETSIEPRQWILNEYHQLRVVRDSQYKLYSDGRFYDVNADPDEQHNLAKSRSTEHLVAIRNLRSVLEQLPRDVDPPFLLRSQSGFRLRAEARKNSVEDTTDVPWHRHSVDDSSHGADGVKLGDINNDGLMDIVTGWEQGGLVRLYLNPGPEVSREPWPRVAVGSVRDAEDAILADLDGDGRLDAISCTEGKTRSVFWHRFFGDDQDLLNEDKWSTSSFPATKEKMMWMQTLAMNIDGLHGSDLILASKGKEATIGWLQAPEDPKDLEAWRYHPLREAGWIMSLIPADMDADGDSDVVFTDRKGSRSGVFWLENPGPFATRKNAPWREHPIGGLDREVMFADMADMNGDGIQDVIVATKPTEIMIFLGQHDGHWQPQSIQLQTKNIGDAKAVKAIDVNGDRIMDLIFSCENATGNREGVIWLEQKDNAPWRQHSLGGPEGVKFDLMQLNDLDGDGDLDVITCEERDQLGVIWYENPYHRKATDR